MTSGPFGTGAFGTGVFSNSPFYSTKTLIDEILRSTNHNTPSAETNRRARVLSFLNNRYAEIAGSHEWKWLRSHDDFNLTAPYEAGTVNVTKGSETVEGVNTSWSAELLPYRKFFITGSNVAYSLASIESATSLILDSRYVGDTDTELTYKVVKPIIKLPADCGDIESIFVDNAVGELTLIGSQEMDRLKAANPTLLGAPQYATHHSRTANDGVNYLEIYPNPDKAYQCHLTYRVNLMKLEDSETNFPLIPDTYRHVLFWGGLMDALLLILHDPTKAKQAELNYRNTLFQFQNDRSLVDSRLVMKPRTGFRKARLRPRGRYFMNRIDFSRYD